MRIFLVSFLFQITFFGYSQINYNLQEFEQTHEQHASCGLSKEVLEKCKAPLQKNTNIYPASSQFTCGKFKVYYADFLPGAPAIGFADPSLGEVRRNTFCAVLTYIQSVFDFSNVPTDEPIRIEVEASFAPVANPAPSSVGYLAYAGPTFNFTDSGTVEGGNVFDYITTGTSNVPNNGFHALMKVNFDSYFIADIQGMYPISWLNDYNVTTSLCETDLFSVLLHEVGHMLGFVSLANNNGQLAPLSLFGNNNFSRLDFLMHRSNDMTASSLQKFILGTPTNCFINPFFSSISITDNKFWANGNNAPNNHPILSGSHFYLYEEGSSFFSSALSHIDEQSLSYTARSRNAPGYSENYVMGPFIQKGEISRSYSDPELTILLNLGYNLNPLYTNSELNNLPPYSIKIGNDPNYPKPFFDSIAQSFYQEIVNADTVITNDIGTTITYNLWEDAGITDPEGQELTVAEGTLTNIRGCGNGGNNHNQLTLSADKKTITFTPRANFIGRAQFAFKLFDGAKVGSWHLYTIDVLTGNNINYPVGSNLLINGDLEEGTEVRRNGGDISKAHTSVEFFFKEGFVRGAHFSDANPYNDLANFWVPFGAGDMIRNSAHCNFGSITNSFDNELNPLPKSNIGDRYRKITFEYNYFGLGKPLQQSHFYVLSFDYYNRQWLLDLNLTTYPLLIGFTNNPTYPALPVLENSFTENLIPIPVNTWGRKEIFFTYCSSELTNFLNIQTDFFDLLVDNIELKEITELPDLDVSINGDSVLCIGSSTLLVANVSNSHCNPSYLWSNGATTSSIFITPTTSENYTVTVNDGFQTAIASKNIIILDSIAENPIFEPVDPICIGLPYTPLPTTSSNSISGVWFPELSESITNYTFLPFSNQCATSTTLEVIFLEITNPLSIDDTTFCLGSTMNNIIGIPTNNVSGFWSPNIDNLDTTTYVFTFTPNDGQCATTATIDVNVLPSPAATILQGNGAIYGICQGDSFELNANLGSDLSYQWLKYGQIIPGATSSTYAVNSTGFYSVRVSLANNCFKESVEVGVNVNSNIPIFTQVPPICSGTALSELPTNSTNWILGTWSPPLNNVETTTYTFTPEEGQCGLETNMTITVNPLPNDSIFIIGSTIICQDDSVLLSANNGVDLVYQWKINGSNILDATESNYLTTTPGSYSLLITNGSNCSVLTNEIVLTTSSNVTPTFNQIAPLISGTLLNELPTTSTNGIIGTWSPEINNTATTTYIFTPNEGQCASSAFMTITVTPTSFSWLVFPSPSNGNLTVQFSGLAFDSQLLVIDARGRLVRKIIVPKNTESLPLDISSLAAGEYFLQIENSNLKEKRKVTKF